MATVTRKQSGTLTTPVEPRSLDTSSEGTTTLLTLRLSPEMDRTIEALMRRTSMPKADVLNMAVGLLKAAVEAVDRGKRVGVAGDEAELEVEFTGL